MCPRQVEDTNAPTNTLLTKRVGYCTWLVSLVLVLDSALDRTAIPKGKVRSQCHLY